MAWRGKICQSNLNIRVSLKPALCRMLWVRTVATGSPAKSSLTSGGLGECAATSPERLNGGCRPECAGGAAALLDPGHRGVLPVGYDLDRAEPPETVTHPRLASSAAAVCPHVRGGRGGSAWGQQGPRDAKTPCSSRILLG